MSTYESKNITLKVYQMPKLDIQPRLLESAGCKTFREKINTQIILITLFLDRRVHKKQTSVIKMLKKATKKN